MKHIIQNYDKLAVSPLREQALRIAEAGLSAVNTTKAVERNVDFNTKTGILKIQNQKFDLNNFDKIICVGFGKVALEAVSKIQKILQNRISSGYVIDLREGYLGGNIESRAGTHPYPSPANVEATKKMVGMLENCTKNDLVIAVVSGGGSSLLCFPKDLTCDQQSAITKVLMDKGADIQELNTVRKHLSSVKGGNLAKICYPATVASLVFSDVPGDDLQFIASGPLAKDTTTASEAAEILKKYQVLENSELSNCRLYETPKEGKYFEKVHNFLVASSHVAIMAMSEKAEDLGWKVKVYSEQFQGEARRLGAELVKLAKPKQCLLGGGESTVKVIGHGLGGRNQEMALAALFSITEGEVLVTIASDGHDNSEAAGAIADRAGLMRARNLGLNPQMYLENNDSYSFFQELGDAVMTGPTSINISDFFVCLKQ